MQLTQDDTPRPHEDEEHVQVRHYTHCCMLLTQDQDDTLQPNEGVQHPLEPIQDEDDMESGNDNYFPVAGPSTSKYSCNPSGINQFK